MFSEIGDIYFLLFFNTKSYKQKTFPRWLLRGEELAVTARFKFTFLLMGKVVKKLQTLGENKNVVLDRIESYLESIPWYT